MGRSSESSVEEELFDVTVRVLKKAGFQILFPDNLNELCCGTPFASKGFKEQEKMKSDELEKELLKITNNGEIPVLCETGTCTKKMLDNFSSNMKIYEPIDFSLEYLVDALEFEKIDDPITIHTNCTTRKMGLHENFVKLASMCAKKVIVPENVKCCGFAGDRGFNFPELNKSALRFLKDDVKDAKLAFSTSKTCEIGLSEYSGLDYNSIFYLIDRTSKAKNI
jgi:D-lactate dehydrogenase